MLADIITIGDEILIGQIVDTNSAYIAARLNETGIRVNRILSISDEREAIMKTLDLAVSSVDLVITTGGLGPTSDDITKQTLREYFGGEFREDRVAMTRIRKLCERRGIPLTERNRFQAMVPDSCITLRNRMGSAPGMLFRKDKVIVVSLPGVSFEMKDILDRELIPLLMKEVELPVRMQKTILTCGDAESMAAEKLAGFEEKLPPHARLAYLPSPGILRLRISLTGKNREALTQQLRELEDEICRIMGEDRVFGFDEDTLPSVLGRMLTDRQASLALAESCTGGTLSQMITSIPGASAYLKGSVTAYANEIKEKVLQVSSDVIEEFGAVSKPVVEQMAEGVRKLMGADFSIATSGIAGPDGGTDEKPVGTTWIAIAWPGGVKAQKFTFGDNRERNIIRASFTALNMLRNIIAEHA